MNFYTRKIENFLRGRADCPWKHAPNLKSVTLTVLELLAFNAQTFRGSGDPSHAHFWKILKGHVRTVPGNMHVIFEVRSYGSFNRFKLV